MATQSSWMSREQQAKAEFVRAALDVRSLLQGAPAPGALQAVDALTEATLNFGTYELRMRTVDRLTTLNLSAPDVPSQEQGLDALKGVLPFVQGLTKLDVPDDHLRRWREASPKVRANWHDHLRQLDVAKGNTEHFARIMDECHTAIDSAGARGLGEWLAERVAELDRIRHQPDDDNTVAFVFPWWKIAAVAVWLGMSAYAVWWRITTAAPWWDIAAIALIALIGALVLSLGC